MTEDSNEFAEMLIKSSSRLMRENRRLRAKLKRLTKLEFAMRWMQVCHTSLRDTFGGELKHLDASVDADRKRLDAIEARLDALEAQRCSD